MKSQPLRSVSMPPNLNPFSYVLLRGQNLVVMGRKLAEGLIWLLQQFWGCHLASSFPSSLSLSMCSKLWWSESQGPCQGEKQKQILLCPAGGTIGSSGLGGWALIFWTLRCLQIKTLYYHLSPTTTTPNTREVFLYSHLLLIFIMFIYLLLPFKETLNFRIDSDVQIYENTSRVSIYSISIISCVINVVHLCGTFATVND